MKSIDRADSVEDNPEIAASLGHIHAPRHVPEYFLERLRGLDPYLEPRWNVLKNRWEIYRDNLYIMTVRTVSGEYAPLDNRVFQKLFLADTRRYRDSFDYINSLHLEDEALMKMKQHDQDEYVRACHRDMMPLLRHRRTVNADPNKIREQERRRGMQPKP